MQKNNYILDDYILYIIKNWQDESIAHLFECWQSYQANNLNFAIVAFGLFAILAMLSKCHKAVSKAINTIMPVWSKLNSDIVEIEKTLRF